MEDKIRSLEVAVNHLELQMLLHKKSVDKSPKEYSESFKKGQTIIFEHVFEDITEIKLVIGKLKEELASVINV